MGILMKGLKLRLLIVPALTATTLFAQGPGGFGGPRQNFGGARGTRTPSTPAQLAANELTMIARSLKLDSAQTSTLTGDSVLVADLTSEQTTLQANAKTVNAAYKALSTDIATGTTGDEAAQQSTIETTNRLSLQVRVAAAGQVLNTLPGLGITVSSTQATSLARMLIGGGFGR